MKSAKEKYQKGVELLRSNELDAALKIFNELIKDFPQEADYWSERGVTYYHLKKKKEALADMDEAVKLQPKKSYRYSSRAYIRGYFKMTDQAIMDYRTAVELDPEDAIAYNNLGLLEEQIGYQNKAIEHFNIADELMNESKEGGIITPTDEPRNIQKEIDEEAKRNSTVWHELKTLATKEGRTSFRRFLQSGFKKT